MITAVIPARLASTRLPNKLLLDLEGKPVLQRVWEQTCQAVSINRVCIATDSELILEQARGWGAEVMMTGTDCASGTDRIASILEDIPGDCILNVQGDEPFIQPSLLDGLVTLWQARQCDLVTAICRITDSDALFDRNLVKVVVAHSGRALYFSRSAIPHIRDVEPQDWLSQHAYWSHIGVYGYSRAALSQFPQLPPSVLEQREKLEQLRFLENDFSIYTLETNYHPLGIDTPADLEGARSRLRASNRCAG